jgi:indolepyruvate ferredoxin oxidoreductase beta subunit
MTAGNAFNVLVMGVGGEGSQSIGIVIARAAQIASLEVKGIQLHGLAQRGGSVPAHVRFGKKVFSPTIPRGEADLVIALEPAEALRAAYFSSKKRANFLVDDFPIIPIYVRLNRQKYPTNAQIEKTLKPFAKKILVKKASGICEENLGNYIYGNSLLLGIALAKKWLPLPKKAVVEALRKTFPKDLENNLKALEMGLKPD